MLTLLAMIGLFLLVLGLVIVLLMGMFFSSDMGGMFVNVFNYATSTGIADLVTVGVMLIILFAAFAVQAVIWFFVSERMLESALPLIVQMIIELIVFIPIPTFFFMAWGLEYRWAGVLCVLIFALPAVYDLGSNVYIKLEEIKENKNSKVD